MACIAALLCGTAAQLQGAALVKMPRARDSEWWLARGRLKPTTTKAPSSPAQPADPRVVDAAPRVLLQSKQLSGVHILTKTRGGEHFLREWLDFHFALGIGKVWLYEDGASAAMDQIARSYGDRVLHISQEYKERGALGAIAEMFHDWPLRCPAGPECPEWIFYTDPDEFLNLRGRPSILSFLEQFNSSRVGAVCLQRFDFGTSGLHEAVNSSVLYSFVHRSATPVMPKCISSTALLGALHVHQPQTSGQTIFTKLARGEPYIHHYVSRGRVEYLKHDIQRLLQENASMHDAMIRGNCTSFYSMPRASQEAQRCRTYFQVVRTLKGHGGMRYGFQSLPGGLFFSWSEGGFHLFNASNTHYVVDQSLVPDDLKALSKMIASAPGGGMVSRIRREETVRIALRAIIDGVDGDFAETGLNTGGTAVLMLKVLASYGKSRRFFGFDSFKGLPLVSEMDVVTPDQVMMGTLLTGKPRSRNQGNEHGSGWMRTSRGAFDHNLRRNNLSHLGDRIQIFEGWFNQTLPRAAQHRMSKGLSFLRLDGDMFSSTWEGLLFLYPKLSIGGYIYVDDYGSFEGCRKAVDLYRRDYNVKEPMWPIHEPFYRNGTRAHHDPFMGGVAPSSIIWKYEAVWWRKSRYESLLDDEIAE